MTRTLHSLTAWIPWVLTALILLSVLYELVTGRARVRGFGIYTRQERPRAYWASVALKTLLAGVVLAIAYLRAARP